MKQILRNKYLKSESFNSFDALVNYTANLNRNNRLDLEDSFGDTYYCYLLLDSLTSAKEFCITFSTDEKEEDLNFLFWEVANLFVLHNGPKIYFIAHDLTIISAFDVTSPLIGLHVFDDNKILILEETTFRLINSSGRVLQEELFDLVLDFKLENNKLRVITDENSKVYMLE
jgi:hypothetical protein